MHTVKVRIFSALLCAAMLAALTACASSTPGGSVEPDASPSPAGTPEQSQPLDTAEPTAEPTEEPTPTPEPEPEYPLYQFGTPLEAGESVEDTYFDDVVFLGDSRTEGLQIYGGLAHGTYYWARGMTVFRVDEPKYAIFNVDGTDHTMIGALRQKEYKAVYIMVGVNELGYPVESYEKGLSAFVDQVLDAQPNAVIYLQVMPPINDELARKNGLADYINNTNLTAFNEVLVRIAGEKRVVLLNTAEVYTDENGQLQADIAADGCHFKASGYPRWIEYLRCHVMDSQRYFYNRALTEEVPET